MKFEGQLAGREVSPRAARTDVNFDVLVHCPTGEFRAQMINLSGRGFRLQSNKSMEAGWEVTLKVGKLAPVRGLVRWVVGDEVGGVFTDPVAL